MDDYISRVLEIIRLTPDEVERLHQEENREQIPVGYDPEKGTCVSFRPRQARCWMSWEIQENFNQPPLKEYFHLLGKGIFADQQTLERIHRINRLVKQALFEGAHVLYSVCKACKWSQTSWDGLWINGEWGPHEDGCRGKVWVNVVKDLETSARLAWINANVAGMHSLDTIVGRRNTQINAVIGEFKEAKNAPKTRLEKIKEEQQRVSDFS